MKNIKIITFILFITGNIFAQVISVEPNFPTDTDSIVITFRADQAQHADLVNYTGTVYTHTGLITDKSSNSNDWKYVIGTWGNNNIQPALTRIETNTYRLVINNPRQYYNVTNPAEKILKLAFVFRSAEANKQTENIYADIYEAGLTVSIESPSSFPIYPAIGDNVDFRILSNINANLSLYIDGAVVKQVNGTSLEYTYNVTSTGKKEIVITGTTANESYADSSYLIARDNLTIQDLPSGLTTGINYINASTVTLALYAPGKDFVYLIGDFNNWEFAPENNSSWTFNSDYYMNQTSDGKIFWKTITGLTPGQEYAFQYLVNGNLRIADPYTEKVLDPWNDSSIEPSTYPNLKPYPVGKTTEITSVFQTQQEEYQWTSTNYHKPDKEKLVIYELLIRDFIAEHDFKAVKDSLNYLKTLGINAIELMPVNEFEGNNSWGYNPSFYFAIDKYYGPANDLKAFIDECHKNNIAVIMDIVLNHSYGQSPLVRLYASDNYGPPTAENPWYNVTSPNTSFSWGYDFNHESPQTQEFVDRVTKFWLTEYKFDGFRFDFTKGFTQKPGDGQAYDASRIAILERMSNQIWNVDPNAYVIFEHLTDNSEEKELANYGIMLWGKMTDQYNEGTMGFNNNNKSDFSNIFYSNRGWDYPDLVGYMESHDEERLMYKNLTYGNSNGAYNIKDVTTALQRIKMAAAFFITVPGPKMIWQFGELGYDYSINYNGRLGNKPIVWGYLNELRRKYLYKTFSELIKLKKNYGIFSTTDYSYNLDGAVKTIYLNSDSIDVAIVGNFDVVNGSTTMNYQSTGTWYDFFSGESFEVPYLQMMKYLQPGEFHIYSNVKLPTPSEDILSDINKNNNQEIPVDYSLYQNYPNPFNPSTIISYTLPVTSKVQINIYDMLGRAVKTLFQGEQTTGIHEITWDGKNNSGQDATSGIYFYTIQANDFRNTKKMILLR